MASTSEIRVFNGAGPTSTAWTNGSRMHRADTNPTTDGSTVFTPIPTSGTNYSWRKWFKLHFLTTPVGSISNLRWFSDAVSAGTGVVFYVKAITTYAQASAADESASMTGFVDETTLTSASPLVVNAGTVLSNPSTGVGTQDYIVQQAAAGTTAVAGTTSARTCTYRFDET